MFIKYTEIASFSACDNSVLIKAEDVDRLLATSEDNNTENALNGNYSEDACNELVMNIKKSLKKSFLNWLPPSLITYFSLLVGVQEARMPNTAMASRNCKRNRFFMTIGYLLI